MIYSEDTLQRVKQAWGSFKGDTRTSQAKAAKAMGMNQSAFSQYLRGEIPLNTDFLHKFAGLTKSDLGEVAPAGSQLSQQPVEVRFTLSGRVLTDKTTLLPTYGKTDSIYAVLVDSLDHPLPRGTMLLVDESSPVRAIDTVILQKIDDGRVILGSLEHLLQEWTVVEPMSVGGKSHTISEHDIVHRVYSSYAPQNTGTIYRS
jgi:transcriptional regulator with XRE-family HTH domain